MQRKKWPPLLSGEKQVTPDTPPAFMVHTSGDKGVPAENSIYFYLAMREAGVDAEMHIYEKGRHGFWIGARRPDFVDLARKMVRRGCNLMDFNKIPYPCKINPSTPLVFTVRDFLYSSVVGI